MIEGTLEDSNIELKGNIYQEKKIMIYGSLPHVIIDLLNNSREVLIKQKIDKPWIEINIERRKEELSGKFYVENSKNGAKFFLIIPQEVSKASI